MNEQQELILTRCVDARIWAKEFIRITKNHPSWHQNESYMIGWFANALIAAYEAYHSRLLDRVKELEQQRDAALKLLKAAICPACDGSGVIIEEHIVPRCCGNYRGNGDCCSEPIPIQELEYQECQWCNERNSILSPKDVK